MILTENVSRLALTCTRKLNHVSRIMKSNLLSFQVFRRRNMVNIHPLYYLPYFFKRFRIFPMRQKLQWCCNGVNFELQYDELPLYLKLLVLLYANDTVVFGTDEKEFQNNLDMFYEYSELWHLSINFDKTKIMIFGTRQDKHFNLCDHKIDICTGFNYPVVP